MRRVAGQCGLVPRYPSGRLHDRRRRRRRGDPGFLLGRRRRRRGRVIRLELLFAPRALGLFARVVALELRAQRSLFGFLVTLRRLPGLLPRVEDARPVALQYDVRDLLSLAHACSF